MTEDVLRRIARQIMALDEGMLKALLPKYKNRMNNFTPTPEWEESVLIYFLINGLRIKNSQFDEKVREYMAADSGGVKAGPVFRPRLRLVRFSPPETAKAPEAAAWPPAEIEPGN